MSTVATALDLRDFSSHNLGRFGEKIAAEHLLAHRMRLLERNWRHPDGEIDLITRDRDEVVFCEVKTRRAVTHGGPGEAIDARKVAQLRSLARHWLREFALWDQPWRIDQLLLMATSSHHFQLQHLKGPRQCRNQ